MQTNSSVERQRMSHSQFQSPSGNTYVRITQQQRSMIPVSSGPGVYVPQGMNIQPVRQSGASFSNQPRPGSSSFQNQPHNLRYWKIDTYIALFFIYFCQYLLTK